MPANVSEKLCAALESGFSRWLVSEGINEPDAVDRNAVGPVKQRDCHDLRSKNDETRRTGQVWRPGRALSAGDGRFEPGIAGGVCFIPVPDGAR
jgi:hypothetical protein